IGAAHSYYLYVVRVLPEALGGVGRDLIADALEAEGIPVGRGYVEPIYMQPMYQQRVAHGRRGCPWTCGHYAGNVDYRPGICPVAERLHSDELLTLDVARPPLEATDIDDVADAFERVISNLDALRTVAGTI